MTHESSGLAGVTHGAVLDACARADRRHSRRRCRCGRSAHDCRARSIEALLAAGIARILIPPRFGGYGLGLDTWFEVVREIAKADASHGWCASLMIHHPHYLGQFPEPAQQAVWADGPDVSIAASIQPVGRVETVEGGYRVSGEFPFASGVNHSRWAIVGCLVEAPGGGMEAKFFLIAPKDFKIKDTWFTSAMRATGSNTIVCEMFLSLKVTRWRCPIFGRERPPGGKLHVPSDLSDAVDQLCAADVYDADAGRGPRRL